MLWWSHQQMLGNMDQKPTYCVRSTHAGFNWQHLSIPHKPFSPLTWSITQVRAGDMASTVWDGLRWRSTQTFIVHTGLLQGPLSGLNVIKLNMSTVTERMKTKGGMLKCLWARYWTPNCSWWAVGTVHGSLCHQCVNGWMWQIWSTLSHQ